MRKIEVTGRVLAQTQNSATNLVHYRLRVTSMYCADWVRPTVWIDKELSVFVPGVLSGVREIMVGDTIKVSLEAYNKSGIRVVGIKSLNGKQDICEYLKAFDEDAMNGIYPPSPIGNEEEEENDDENNDDDGNDDDTE